MSSVQDTDVCIVCGEEYWYDFDCRTGEYTKLSMCKCDRQREKLEQKIKKLKDELKYFRDEAREIIKNWENRDSKMDYDFIEEVSEIDLR